MTIIAQTPAYATAASYGGADTCVYNDTSISAGFAATAQNTILYLPATAWDLSGTVIKIRWYLASDGSFLGQTTFAAADGTGTVTKALAATFAIANGAAIYPLMVSDGTVNLNTDGANTFQTFNPTGTYASPPTTINPATDPGATRAKFRVALDGTATAAGSKLLSMINNQAGF